MNLSFAIDATYETAAVLKEAGIDVRVVNNVQEGRPHVLDFIKNNEYSYIVNTSEGRVHAMEDAKQLRRAALLHKINYATTMNAALATCLSYAVDDKSPVQSLQALHAGIMA